MSLIMLYTNQKIGWLHYIKPLTEKTKFTEINPFLFGVVFGVSHSTCKLFESFLSFPIFEILSVLNVLGMIWGITI